MTAISTVCPSTFNHIRATASFNQQLPTASFNLQNFCNDLNHLVIFDYAEWSQTEDLEADQVLLSLDRAVNNMDQAYANFVLAASNLYLVRAYFDDGEIEMIIELSDRRNPSLDLRIARGHAGPDFEENNSYTELTFQEADQIVNSMHE